MIKSVTRSKAGVISRLADFLQFRTNPTKTTEVAGNRAIGGVSVSQTLKGIFYPTVQSAIDDLANRCDLPINTVVHNTDGVIPGFTSQSDQLKFDGIIAGDSGPKMIYVLGFPVTVESTDTAILVASKAAAVLTDASVNGIAISTVEIDTADSSILNITYNDYQDHVIEPTIQQGVSITQTIVVQPRAGYGNWEQMGTQDVTLTGGSVNGTITLYYFKRVS